MQFSGCTSLSLVGILEEITFVDKGAFWYCRKVPHEKAGLIFGKIKQEHTCAGKIHTYIIARH